MPTLDDITSQSSAAFSAAEENYLRYILRKDVMEGFLLSDTEVTAALTSVTAEQRQELRAHFDAFGPYDQAGRAELHGGSDALDYDAALERWNIRNYVRILLGFGQEPRPTGQGGMQFVQVSLNTMSTPSEDW